MRKGRAAKGEVRVLERTIGGGGGGRGSNSV